MGGSFGEVLKAHGARYPLMEPQDYGKLAFQSEFGPEHMIEDKQWARAYLLREWKEALKVGEPGISEDIGGGLCRFPLSACPSRRAAELLADLFLMTAQEPAEEAAGSVGQTASIVQGENEGGAGSGTGAEAAAWSGCNAGAEAAAWSGSGRQKKDAKQTGHGRNRDRLADKLEQLARLEVPGMREWLADWKERDCPPVHHSKAYKDAYQPHYRLLRKEYVGYFPVLLEICGIMEKKGTAVVAIDGRCAGGKTHFARLIGRLFPCNILHMDDFYLPIGMREGNWTEIPGGNIDFARFRSEVLDPVKAGKACLYRPYNCRKGEMEEGRLLPYRPLTVAEGGYSHHPSLAECYDLKIFLTCSGQEQTARLHVREGEHFSAYEERWVPMEERYFRYYAIESGSDLTVDTSAFFG